MSTPTVDSILSSIVERQDETFQKLQELVAAVKETANESLNVNFPEFGVLSQYDPYAQMSKAEGELKALVDSAPEDSFDKPADPGSAPTVTIDGTTQLAAVTVPDFTKAAPTLTYPNAPSLPSVSAPGSAPVVTTPPIPDAPTYTIPAAPSLESIVLPTPPTIEFPTFSGQAPAFTLTPPSNSFAFQEIPYSSDLLEQITADLLSDLRNGGYGINTADEQGVWNRAREREEAAALTEEDNIRSEFAGRGFSLPPGAMFGAIAKLRQKLRESIQGLSRDTAVKRYDQLFEARKSALGLGFQVESALLTYHGQMMERSLTFARSVVEVAISVYQAALAGFNARLEAYKTEASAFETLLRAEVEKVNVYRAQLEGARLIGEIDKNKLQLYTAQLQGIEAMVRVYSERMNAAKVQADIERLRLDGYKTSVDAYVSQINAGEAQVRLYEAQIRGQTARVEGYRAEVQAYQAQVSGKEAQVRALSERVRASVEAARAAQDGYRSKVEAYRASVQAESERVGASARVYEAQTRGVTAYASTMKEIGESYVRKNQWDMADRFKRLDSQVEKAKLDYNQLFQNRGIRLEAGKWETDVWKEIAGSALASLDGVVAQVKEE